MPRKDNEERPGNHEGTERDVPFSGGAACYQQRGAVEAGQEEPGQGAGEQGALDQAPGTRQWLADMHRTDQRALRSVKGWSVTWPLARSTASALTRVGDPEPMRRFITGQLGDDTGETANLNYWAF